MDTSRECILFWLFCLMWFFIGMLCGYVMGCRNKGEI